MPTAENVKRQIAIAIVIAMKEPPLLMTVQRIVGGIEIEDNMGREASLLAGRDVLGPEITLVGDDIDFFDVQNLARRLGGLLQQAHIQNIIRHRHAGRPFFAELRTSKRRSQSAFRRDLRLPSRRARPGVFMKRSIAPAATWRTASRNVSLISSPIAPRRPRCDPIKAEAILVRRRAGTPFLCVFTGFRAQENRCPVAATSLSERMDVFGSDPLPSVWP